MAATAAHASRTSRVARSSSIASGVVGSSAPPQLRDPTEPGSERAAADEDDDDDRWDDARVSSRGPATAPIWEFTLEGTAVKVTRVAIANPVVVAPDEGGWGLGLAIDSASGSVKGSELTVAFVGAPNPGNMACGEDYTAEAVESDLAVVVIVTRHPRVVPLGEACPAVGARRTATATLAVPLGDRAVLDLQQGTPVAIVLHP